MHTDTPENHAVALTVAFNNIRRIPWRTEEDLHFVVSRNNSRSILFPRIRDVNVVVGSMMRLRQHIYDDPTRIYPDRLNHPSRCPLWLKLHYFFEEPTTIKAKIYMRLYLILMILSLIPFIWESVPGTTVDLNLIKTVEDVAVGLFTFETFVRFSVYPSFAGYFKNVTNWLDIVVAASFVVDLCLPNDIGPQKTLSLFYYLRPIVRLYAATRKFPLPKLFHTSMRMAVEPMLVALYVFTVVILFFGTLLYFSVQVKSNAFPTIFEGAYVSWYTIPGVGYRFASSLLFSKIVAVALIGLGTIYMPIPLQAIGSYLNMVWYHRHTVWLLTIARRQFEDYGFGRDCFKLIFKSMDHDKDGVVSYNDFLTFCEAIEFPEMYTRQGQERIFEIFSDLDYSRKGELTMHAFILGVIRSGIDGKTAILRSMRVEDTFERSSRASIARSRHTFISDRDCVASPLTSLAIQEESVEHNPQTIHNYYL